MFYKITYEYIDFVCSGLEQKVKIDGNITTTYEKNASEEWVVVSYAETVNGENITFDYQWIEV